MYNKIYSTTVTIHPTQIILTTEQVSGFRSHKNLSTWQSNFKEKATKGKISKQAQKKISRAIDYLMYNAKPKEIPKGYRGAGKKFKICFVTLTLPSKQIHSDKLIVQEILQPMLNWLRKHHDVRNYIWRAEKQKNNNIHFHLLCDRFIDKSDLRQSWNRYCQNLGYVSRYKANQLDWNKNGFTVRKRLLKTWSENAQKEAYLRGLTEDWCNPNTTDVHSIKRLHNVKKYLCKYLCKSKFVSIPSHEIDGKLCSELLTISGRLWACSESLSKIRGAKTDWDSVIQTEIDYISTLKDCRIFEGNHFTIFGIYITRIPQDHCPEIKRLWAAYLQVSFP